MRTLLVFGDKTFRIQIPDDAKVTFGPWAPPSKDGRPWGEEGKRGTLRVYGRTKEDVLAVFAGVTGFRDMAVGYAEQVARVEGETIWHDDVNGYSRETKVNRNTTWVEDPVKTITAGGGDGGDVPF